MGGEGDDRGWDGGMASPTQWTWVWVSSGSWWWRRRPGMLQSMGLPRVRHDWVTELGLAEQQDGRGLGPWAAPALWAANRRRRQLSAVEAASQHLWQCKLHCTKPGPLGTTSPTPSAWIQWHTCSCGLCPNKTLGWVFVMWEDFVFSLFKLFYFEVAQLCVTLQSQSHGR